MEKINKVSGYIVNPLLQKKNYKLTPESKKFIERGRELLTKTLKEIPSL